MLPKNGLLVKKKYFLDWIMKVHDKTYNLEQKKNSVTLTFFELTNEIGHFESLWIVALTLEWLLSVQLRYTGVSITEINVAQKMEKKCCMPLGNETVLTNVYLGYSNWK